MQAQLRCDPVIAALAEEIAWSLAELLRDNVEACGEGKGLARLPWRQVPALRGCAGKRHGAPGRKCEWLCLGAKASGSGRRLGTYLSETGRMSRIGVPCCLTDCNSLSDNHGTPMRPAPVPQTECAQHLAAETHPVCRLFVSLRHAGTHTRHHVKVVCCRRASVVGGFPPGQRGSHPRHLYRQPVY